MSEGGAEGEARGSGDVVILVHSTSHAVHIERRLVARGVPCRMIPVPRHLSSDCGACVQVPGEHAETAREAVAASGIEIQGIVPL